MLTPPPHIAEAERELLDMGAPVTHVAILKTALLREVTNRDNQRANTELDTVRFVEELTEHPDIKAAIKTFAQRYRAYLAQNEAVIAANNFRQDLFRLLPTLPKNEALHMANKVITALSHMIQVKAKDIYNEVLWLIGQNKKGELRARTFHSIIDMYVDKITSGERLLDGGSMHAWTMLDKMVEILMTDPGFLYKKDPKTLNAKGRRIQEGIKLVIEGIQKRNTAMIHNGFKDEFLRKSEMGELGIELLWRIEHRLH